MGRERSSFSKRTSAYKRLLLSPANDPPLSIVPVLFDTVDLNKVSRTTVTPPELTTDTPILNAFEPTVPFILGLLGLNIEFPCARALEIFSSMIRYVGWGGDRL